MDLFYNIIIMITLDKNFISITDLQKNTKFCLSDIKTVWKKVILSNNKPQAILLSLNEFFNLTNKEKAQNQEDIPSKNEIKAINNYQESEKEWLLDFIIADKNYFDNLKK